MIRVLQNLKISKQIQLAAIYSLEDSKIVTINFFKSKVFTVVFLCLLTNLSIPEASATTGTTSEYGGFDGGSELHSQRFPEFRWVKCSTERGERIPIYDANRQPNVNSIVGYLSIGDRVTLAGNKISNYIRISEPINGYVNANELTLIQPNIEECNRIFSQETYNDSYNNRVSLGTYLIKQEVFPSLFSERRSIRSYRMMRYGEEIKLPPGSAITVTDTRIFRNQRFDQQFETRLLEAGEDPNKHGWLKVEVKFPEGAYEGYIEYRYVDISNNLRSEGGSSPYYCFSQNINWQGSFLPVISNNGQRIYDLPMNQPVLKTGGRSQYNSYEFVEIEITNGFGGKLTGWVENRPLFGQYRDIENLRLC